MYHDLNIWQRLLYKWHPTTQENMQNLQRVQNRAARFIYGKTPPPPLQTNIMPLDMQLQYIDLYFFKKCLGGDIDYDAKKRIVEGRTLRGDDPQHPRLQPAYVGGVALQRGFAFRICKPWNNLPAALKTCTTKQFPSLCKSYLWQDN